jgi:hypothetical protein
MKEEIIPSGKLTKNCGRSPSLIGKKQLLTGPFSIAMSN